MTIIHQGVFFSPAILARVGVPQWWKCTKNIDFSLILISEMDRGELSSFNSPPSLLNSKGEDQRQFSYISRSEMDPGEFSSFNSKVKSWWYSSSWWIKWEFPCFTFSIAKCLKMLSFIGSGSPTPASMAKQKNTPGRNRRIHRHLIPNIVFFSQISDSKLQVGPL